jgi:hypothetical protein
MPRRTLFSLVTLTLLAGCGGGGHATTTTSSTAGRQQLISLLGVLRRPATPRDTTPGLVADLAQRAHVPDCAAQVADRGLTRRVATLKGGVALYLVAFRPARCQLRCKAPFATCQRPQPEREWIGIFAEPQSYKLDTGRWTANDIAAKRAFAGYPDLVGGRSLAIAVVPDRIRRVTMRVGPIARPPTRSVVVPVHDNVAVLATPPGMNVELGPY